MSNPAPPTGRSQNRWLSPQDWSLRVKLAVALLVPSLIAVALGGLRVGDQVGQASEFDRVARYATAQGQVADLVKRIQDERLRATEFVAAGRTGDSAPLQSAFAEVDAEEAASRPVIAEIAETDDTVIAAQRQAEEAMTRLPQLRDLVLRSDTAAATTVARYSELLDAVLPLDSALLRGVNSAQVNGLATALGGLTAARDEATLQRALIAVAVADRNGLELSGLPASEARLGTGLNTFRAALSTGQRSRHAGILAGQASNERARLINNLIATDTAQGLPPGIAGDASRIYGDFLRQLDDAERGIRDELVATGDAARSTAVNLAVLNVVLLLAALLIGALIVGLIARALLTSLRTLRSSALEIAQKRLPDAVQRMRGGTVPDVNVSPVPVHTREEVGEVARAFDAVHAQAVRLAAEQATLQNTVNSMFVNLSRRSQSLVDRQLQLIEELESNEQDPDQLASLFRLDHLATRMRRNSENLLVLAGNDNSKRTGSHVPVVDVLQAAVSEVEQYERVTVEQPPAVAVLGRAANDLQHLLSELLDNATSFSAPDTQVRMSTQREGSGPLVVEIVDHGIGMRPDELEEVNRRFADADDSRITASRRMGLFVVGRLAARHGVQVRLISGSSSLGASTTGGLPLTSARKGGGLTARVTVPAHLVASGPAGMPRRPEQGRPGAPSRSAGGQPTIVVPPQRTSSTDTRRPAPESGTGWRGGRAGAGSRPGSGGEEIPAHRLGSEDFGAEEFGAERPGAERSGAERTGGGAEQADLGRSNAEPIGAEPVGAEPVDAEPVGAEPVGGDPAWGAPSSVDAPDRDDPDRVEAEPADADDGAAVGQSDVDHGGPDRPGPGRRAAGRPAARVGADPAEAAAAPDAAAGSAEQAAGRVPEPVSTGVAAEQLPTEPAAVPAAAAAYRVDGAGEPAASAAGPPRPVDGAARETFTPSIEPEQAAIMSAPELFGPSPVLDDDPAGTTPIFEEVASGWFRAYRKVPINWQPDDSGEVPEQLDSIHAARLAPAPPAPEEPTPVPALAPAPSVDAGAGDDSFASPADDGWRAAVEAREAPLRTVPGTDLPRRVPGAQLVPGGIAAVGAARAMRDAEAIRSRLSNYQRGVRTGRSERDRPESESEETETESDAESGAEPVSGSGESDAGPAGSGPASGPDPDPAEPAAAPTGERPTGTPGPRPAAADRPRQRRLIERPTSSARSADSAAGPASGGPAGGRPARGTPPGAGSTGADRPDTGSPGSDAPGAAPAAGAASVPGAASADAERPRAGSVGAGGVDGSGAGLSESGPAEQDPGGSHSAASGAGAASAGPEGPQPPGGSSRRAAGNGLASTGRAGAERPAGRLGPFRPVSAADAEPRSGGRRGRSGAGAAVPGAETSDHTGAGGRGGREPVDPGSAEPGAVDARPRPIGTPGSPRSASSRSRPTPVATPPEPSQPGPQSGSQPGPLQPGPGAGRNGSEEPNQRRD